METTNFSSGGASAQVKEFQKGNQLRMEYQSSPAFVILDDGKTIYRLDVARRTAYESFVEKPPKRLDLLFTNYQLKSLGIKELLGRQTVLISIEPKHPGNPKKKVWIDLSTAIILRMEQFKSNGKRSRMSFYTNIDFDAEVPAEFFKLPQGFKVIQTKPNNCKRLSKSEIRKAVGFEILEPRSLPEGYILDGFHLSYCPMGRPMVHLRYFDGLNSISLFEHPTNDEIWSSPAIAYNRVFIGSNDNKLYCLNANTGVKIWDYSTGGKVWSSPTVADGKVYVGSNNGKVYCLDALSEKAIKLWEHFLGKGDWSHGVASSRSIANGKVFVGCGTPDNAIMYCFGGQSK